MNTFYSIRGAAIRNVLSFNEKYKKREFNKTMDYRLHENPHPACCSITIFRDYCAIEENE